MDLSVIRAEFPALAAAAQTDKPLVYLDSAATTLKPRCVIDAVANAMAHDTAAVHRSVSHLGDRATAVYEDARRAAAWFIGAEPSECVFVRNATEGVNLVAAGWPRRPGAKALVSNGDHHAAILPWRDQVIRLAPTAEGTLDMEALEAALARHDIDLVAVSHVSNVTGIAVDAAAVAELAHAHGALVLLDAAQSAPHRPLDVLDLDCDFLVFSSHKLCGPSGIGVLYAKSEHLERLQPMLWGGSMVAHVGLEGLELNEIPQRFEAGSPPLEAAAGFAAALAFLQGIGLEAIHAHEQALTQQALRLAEDLEGAELIGPARSDRCGPLSFVLPGQSPHRVARSLSDVYGICVRSGMHCAEPLHLSMEAPASLRASFYLYNTPAEIDLFFHAMGELLALTPHG